jgi:hypothetical protein
MRERSNTPQDPDTLRRVIVSQATRVEHEPDPSARRNPAAVELGRLGGLKGGKARAAKLTPEERSAAARKAAQARWSGRP